MFMACSFGGVGAIPPRDSVTSIRVGLAPARIRYLSRRFQSPWKIANVVVRVIYEPTSSEQRETPPSRSAYARRLPALSLTDQLVASFHESTSCSPWP